MAWVAVTKQGREFISMCKPIRVTDEDNYYGWKDTFTEISLPKGSIKKLIGRELSFTDEPVELGQIKNEKGYLYLRHNYKGCYVCQGL